ncbi:hypothetical protein ACFOMD_08515 [Sphingoaurantiacus capsulatus]|uniref:Uncharacterized protein n=1 Tax=Sphingoaurantiacus capsulatus TaxID=1771310 RepID=A0ABV7XAY9_9SPHN
MAAVAVLIALVAYGKDLFVPAFDAKLPLTLALWVFLAIGFDWAFLSKFKEVMTAYSEEEPRYLDYKARLWVTVLGVLVIMAGEIVEPRNVPLVMLGGTLCFATMLYGAVQIFRDLKNPPDRKL